MKLGVTSLVIGIALLLVTIPYSIFNIVSAVFQLSQSSYSGGGLAYLGVAGVVAGFLLTAFGAVRVAFNNKKYRK